MKKIRDFITNHNLLIVIISLLLLIPSGIGYMNTRINYDILVYLPEDYDTVKGQNILTEDFNMGAFSFVMLDNMSNYDMLKLEEKIRKIDSVNLAVSLADVTDTTIPIDMIPDSVKEKLSHDKEKVIVVTFANSTSNDKTINAIRELRKTVKNASSVSGMTAMVVDTMDISNKEVVSYVVISVLLCLIVLTLATNSYIIPILLLGNIGLAIIYNMGTNIIFGEISYITKAISAVLQLGVTTDFSIFLYHKYEQAKEKNKNNKLAMRSAISETFKSVIGSSLTTIAGFLALCAMNLTLGKDIGLVMAKGVLFGLICVLTVFPALLLTFDKYIDKTKHKVLIPEFKFLQNFSVKYYKIILVIFIILLIPAIYGYKNIKVYYKLDESLPDNLPFKIANDKLKNNYSIASPQIILIDNKIKVEDINKMIDEINKIKGINMAISPSSILDFGLPLDMLDEDLEKHIKNDKYQLLVINSTYEVASTKLNKQIDDIDKVIKKYNKNAIIVGEGALTKDLIETSDIDIRNVNYLSIGIIFILMLLVLKSLSLPVILICIIEFAIFANMGLSFYTNNTLPFITSIVIGTIQLGATIDYAILMSTKYIEERNKNSDKFIAMKNTLEVTVPSIIVSALCFFAATVGVYIYSKIDLIGSICKLLSRGAIISMLSVVIILPSIILIFDNLIIKTTKNLKEVK